MVLMEELAHFNTEPAKIKAQLEALARFVRFTCGIHARLAFSNEVDKLTHIPDAELKKIVMETFKDL